MGWDGVERRENPLCKLHGDELRDIWLLLRGNGDPEHGLAFKVQLVMERQKTIYEFVKGVRGIFWVCLPICVAGAVAAIWQTLKLLVEHGKL